MRTTARSRRHRSWWWLGGLGGLGALGLFLSLLPWFGPIEPTRLTVLAGAESTRVTGGERYRAGPLRRLFRGTHYREVWTEPVVVPVLQLEQFDGGLWPVREGGGLETRSLHLVSDSGRRWVFRSSDKELSRLLIPGLRRSLLAWMVQDQVKALHPAAAFVAAPLQRELGLASSEARLVVLPDEVRLGQFRGRFGGLLGTLLPAPQAAEATGDSIVHTTLELLAALDSGSARVDARAFLTARLLDFILNDWDRHAGQWRWLRGGGGRGGARQSGDRSRSIGTRPSPGTTASWWG